MGGVTYTNWNKRYVTSIKVLNSKIQDVRFHLQHFAICCFRQFHYVESFLDEGQQRDVARFPFSLNCVGATTFVFLSVFTLMETVRSKNGAKPLFNREKISLPFAFTFEWRSNLRLF